MRIEGAISANVQQYAQGPGQVNKGARSAPAPAQARVPDYSSRAEASVPVAAEEASPPEAYRGVIRLLLAGHFKGVADVRLRINFFEELSAIQGGKFQEVAGEQVPGLMESVQETVEKLLSSGELSGESSASLAKQLEEFTQAVNLALEDFQNSPHADKEELLAGLDAAFEDLAAFIGGLFPAAGPEAPVEGVPDAGDAPESGDTNTSTPGADTPTLEETAVAAAPEEEFSVTGFLEELRSVYETARISLKDGFDQADILPPLSEPEGQGKAYAKFLAIYQNLVGGGEAAASEEKGALLTTSV